MKAPTKAAPVEKEEEEIVEIPVTVGIPPPSVADRGSGVFFFTSPPPPRAGIRIRDLGWKNRDPESYFREPNNKF
jgi:hypothetical protein